MLAGTSPAVIGDVFNLGGAQPLTLEQFAATLIRVAGRGSYRIVPFPEDRKAIDMGSVYTDSTKFREACGWTPQTPLEDGLRQTIDFYTRHKSHYW
jgi:nucleoside-diphosphate-sugar epimerase